MCTVCMWMLEVSSIGPRMAPMTAPARETFPDNDLISFASTLRASHDLRMHSRFHIRCMRAYQSENHRHHLPGRGEACWCQCTLLDSLFCISGTRGMIYQGRTQDREPSHRCHQVLLQQLCSLLLRHQLHAKWFLYQPLLGLIAGLQPLPTDHCWCANWFPHRRHIYMLVVQLFPQLGYLPLGYQIPYEVGLIGLSAEKLSPLLDHVTWRHVSQLYSCSAPLVRSLCVLDRVFSIRIEDQVDSMTPYSFMKDVSQCWLCKLSEYLVIALHLLNQNHIINDCWRRLSDVFCW